MIWRHGDFSELLLGVDYEVNQILFALKSENVNRIFREYRKTIVSCNWFVKNLIAQTRKYKFKVYSTDWSVYERHEKEIMIVEEIRNHLINKK